MQHPHVQDAILRNTQFPKVAVLGALVEKSCWQPDNALCTPYLISSKHTYTHTHTHMSGEI